MLRPAPGIGLGPNFYRWQVGYNERRRSATITASGDSMKKPAANMGLTAGYLYAECIQNAVSGLMPTNVTDPRPVTGRRRRH
jgi:hypothetical protein